MYQYPEVPSREGTPQVLRRRDDDIDDVEEDLADQIAREQEERQYSQQYNNNTHSESASPASPGLRRLAQRQTSFSRAASNRTDQHQPLERKSSQASMISEGAGSSYCGTPTTSPRQRSVIPADAMRSTHLDMSSQRSGATVKSMSRKSTFRQTALKNIEAMKRDGIHRPLLSRDFPQAKIPSIGVIAGFVNFFKCDNAITTEKPPCCDTNDEYIHLRVMTDGERENLFAVYADEECTNTVVLAPAGLIAFLLAIVIYCGIIVFWAPNTRLYESGGLPWRGGELSGVEAFLPMAMAALYVAAITYANTLNISFTMFERQYLIEPEVLTSLQGREVSLNRPALETLASVQAGAKLPFVRPSIVKKVRWYQQDLHEALPADLYLNYINSLAAMASAKEYKISSMTSLVNVALPLLVAVAPCFARIFRGGSLWGNGLAEEFCLVLCGPVLTMMCCYGIVAMLNVFAFTMKFHRYRMEWLTLALPDPTRLSETSWPTIPFDSLENLLIWHRMRSAILKPPMALYLWGRRLSEVTFMMFMLLVVLSMAYNFVSGGAGNTSFDSSTALMIALLVTLAPLMLYIFYTPLRSTLLHQEQIDGLNNILMLSIKDIGLQRGAPGVTDEVVRRIQDIRSAIKIVARSIKSEEEIITFLGFPLSVNTMMLMAMVFFGVTSLVLMRGVYGKDAFI